MNSIIIIFIIIVFIDGIMKKKNLLELYIEGVKEVFQIMIPIFSTLLTYTIFVELLRSSHFIEFISQIFSPVTSILSIPIDIIVLSILRPISSSISLTYLHSIYELFGVDHVVSILASIIHSNSDTTLYVTTLYFSSIKKNNHGYAIKVGLLLDFLAIILSIIFYLKFIV